MEIKGSCYCRKVKLTAVSHTPYPYMRCYCTICRKAAGGGGYAINIMAQTDTFKVEGEEHVSVHDNWVDDDEHPGELKKSTGKGYYCRHCGSAVAPQNLSANNINEFDFVRNPGIGVSTPEILKKERHTPTS